MPSLWKKQKPNRITRLVADIQSTPKKGGSLVVETGFPTSIVDLFVKNKDRLKKPKSKKQKSSKHAATPTTPKTPTTPTMSFSDEFYSIPPSTPVSCKQSFSFPIILDVPTSSSDDKKQETTVDDGFFDPYVEETVTLKRNNYVDVGIEDLKYGCCDDNDGLYYDKYETRDGGVLETKKKRNSIWVSVLKGALVVVVALYTKRFVVGILMGALLLFLLEYVGNQVFRFFKPCEDAMKRLQLFSKSRKKGRKGVLQRAMNIGSTRPKDGANGVGSKGTIEEKVEDNVVSNSEFRNDVAIKEIVEQEYSCGMSFAVASSGEIEQGSGSGSSLVEEMPNTKLACEIEVLEPISCELPRMSSYDGPLTPVGYCKLGGRKGVFREGEKEGEGFEVVNHKGKFKKGKKFWKKLVPKHIHKKKKLKHGKGKSQVGCEALAGCHEEISAEFEEEYELEDEQDVAYGDRSSISSLSSSSDDEEFEGLDRLVAPNRSNSKLLQIDNKSSKTSGIVKARGWNVKCMAITGIALAGLIKGRVFALILTVICCLLSRMVR